MLTLVLFPIAATALAPGANLQKHSSQYYDIESNLPAEKVRQLGKIMDAAGKEYHRRFDGYSGTVRRRLKLKVYAKKEEFVEAMKRTTEGSKAAFTAGMFIPLDETVYTYDGPHMEHVLRHECFHQFTHFVVGGRLDTWVNEGLAEYFGIAQFDPASGDLKTGNLDRSLVEALADARQRGTLMSVDEVLTISRLDWHANMGTQDAGTQYAQAWALCHFLIHADGGKYQKFFEDYLRLVDKHLDGATAFKRVFGADTTPLQEKYRAYIDYLISVVEADKAQKAKATQPAGG